MDSSVGSCGGVAATEAGEPRFEVLEEETHYPATHPKSVAAAAAVAEDQANEEAEKEDSLEEQLAKLSLTAQENGDEKDAKQASAAKELGNKFFAQGRLLDAVECYTTALKLCPADEDLAYSRAVFFSNRAACLLRLGRTDEAIDDCTQAIALSPTYIKALLRRAEAYEKADKLEEALADLDAVLKVDPSVRPAIKSRARIAPVVEERREKMKAEMLDKLKGFGNTILGKFGLSTDNFQMVQDPATGSYSINFSQNAQQPNGQRPNA